MLRGSPVRSEGLHSYARRAGRGKEMRKKKRRNWRDNPKLRLRVRKYLRCTRDSGGITELFATTPSRNHRVVPSRACIGTHEIDPDRLLGQKQFREEDKKKNKRIRINYYIGTHTPIIAFIRFTIFSYRYYI